MNVTKSVARVKAERTEADVIVLYASVMLVLVQNFSALQAEA